MARIAPLTVLALAALTGCDPYYSADVVVTAPPEVLAEAAARGHLPAVLTLEDGGEGAWIVCRADEPLLVATTVSGIGCPSALPVIARLDTWTPDAFPGMVDPAEACEGAVGAPQVWGWRQATSTTVAWGTGVLFDGERCATYDSATLTLGLAATTSPPSDPVEPGQPGPEPTDPEPSDPTHPDGGGEPGEPDPGEPDPTEPDAGEPDPGDIDDPTPIGDTGLGDTGWGYDGAGWECGTACGGVAPAALPSAALPALALLGLRRRRR